MHHPFLEAMRFRHACKLFDETKTIPDETWLAIIEAGVLSPSSFGMEPWRFVLVENRALREQLRKASWDQAQLTSCSHLLAITALKADLRPDMPYPRAMLARRIKDETKLDAYMQRYGGFMQDKLEDAALACWSIKQCYIAAGNMMSAAAFMGVDSCAIEGFEKQEVERLLGLDVAREEIALMVTFGYRAKKPMPSVRLCVEELLRRV